MRHFYLLAYWLCQNYYIGLASFYNDKIINIPGFLSLRQMNIWIKKKRMKLIPGPKKLRKTEDKKMEACPVLMDWGNLYQNTPNHLQI